MLIRKVNFKFIRIIKNAYPKLIMRKLNKFSTLNLIEFIYKRVMVNKLTLTLLKI